jgi:2-polyprenyl-6-methoxyphenol hydroxylase-like FAD-dependent oxidoreductase
MHTSNRDLRDDLTSRMPDIDCDVLIVGARPTGLMTACILAKLGVTAVVVDPRDGTTRESRALGLQARTMELFEQLGIVEEVRERAWVARALAIGYEKHQLGRLPLDAMGSDVTPYPAIHVLKQSDTEQILETHLKSLGGQVRWENRLTALTDHPGGVEAVIADQSGDVVIRSRWCVGADGASSDVRKLRGIAYEGSTNERSYYVADAIDVKGLIPDTINERLGSQDFLLTFPMGDSSGEAGDTRRHHRLLGPVRGIGDSPEDDPGSASRGVDESAVRAMLKRVFGVTYTSSASFSTYRVHHRVAEKYRDGAVFLAGDAAHVHSPVGAQGMNTGLQDGHCLAVKLADVVAGVASDSSLDRYEGERRPVALHLVRTTDRIFSAVTSERKFAQFVRRRVLPVAVPIVARIMPRLPGGGRTLQFISEVRIHYRMSEQAHVRAHERSRKMKPDRVVGRRLPWTRAGHATLRSMRWQVHSYGPLAEVIAADIRARLDIEVNALEAAPNQLLQRGRLYLVRPDGFVAAEVDAVPLERAVTQLAEALPDLWSFRIGTTALSAASGR